VGLALACACGGAGTRVPRAEVAHAPPAPVQVAPDPLREAFALQASGDTAGAQALLTRERVALEIDLADSPAQDGAAAWSSNGARVAVAGRQGVRVLERSTGREVAPPIRRRARALALDSRGALLATATGDEVEVHRVEDAVRVAHFDDGAAHGLVAFSPDGNALVFPANRRAASGRSQSLVLVGTSSWKELAALPASAASSNVTFLEGGRMRIRGAFELEGNAFRLGPERLVSTTSGEVLMEVPGGLVRGPGRLAVTSIWGTVAPGAPMVHDVIANRSLGSLAATGCERAEEAVAGPPGAPLATLLGQRVCLWDLERRALLNAIDIPGPHSPLHEDVGDVVRFTANGRGVVLSLRTDAPPRRRAWLHDVASGALVEELGEVLFLDPPLRDWESPDPRPADPWMIDPERKELLRARSAERVERRPFDRTELLVLQAREWEPVVRTDGRGILVLDPHRGTLEKLEAPRGAWSLRLAPDLGAVLGRSEEGLRVWRLGTPTPIASIAVAPKTREIADLGFTRDELVVWSTRGDEDRVELTTGALRSMNEESEPDAWNHAHAILRADGSSIVIPSRREPRVHAGPGDAKPRPFAFGSRPGDIGALALSPDGKQLAATVTETGGWDMADVRLFDARSGALTRRLPTFGASTVAFDPGGNMLITSGWAGLERWDLRKPRPVVRREDAHPVFLVFSPDGATLVYREWNNGAPQVRVASAVTLQDICSTPEGAVSADDASSRIAVSADGALFATARGARVSVFSARDCKLVDALETGLDAPIVAIAFHPGGKLFAAASGAGDVALVRTSDRRPALMIRLAAASGSEPGAAVVVADRRIELLGDAARAGALAQCRAGGYAFPLAVCESAARTRGLVAAAAR
jgi:WD40 repeat protein